MIEPIGKNVLATIEEASKISPSGLYLTDKSAEALAPKVAKILGVGDEVTKVKKDDRVVFKPYATYEVKEDREEFVIIEEVDVLGVIKS